LIDLTAIQPVSAIIGGLLSASIGGAITFLFVVKRRSVAFSIAKSEDLTLPLRREHPHIVFIIGDLEMLNLNRGSVRVRNDGNATLKDLEFTIEIPYFRGKFISDKLANNAKLSQSVALCASTGKDNGANSRLEVSVPFLNPKESFEVVIHFEGVTKDFEVHCRMEDVRVRVKRSDPFTGASIESASRLHPG